MILAAAMNPELPLSIDDEAAKLRRGDPNALSAVITRYQHRLFRYLSRLVADPAVAEDLFQQTWVRVMDNIRRYDARRSFDGWLFSVAHNLAIDHLRRKQPASLDDTADSSRPFDPPAVNQPDPLEQLLDFERGRLVAAAVAQLPAIHREVLALRFEHDLKLEEIAQITGAPLATVKSRLCRALEGLRKRLGGGVR